MPERARKLIFLGAVIFALILLDKPFFGFKESFTASLGETLQKFFPNYELRERIRELEQENENLKLTVFNMSIQGENKIKVYSSYPFNDKSQIYIAAGEDRNIKVGDLATYGQGILVGKVIRVLQDASIIQTIFDPDWKMAVRVGDREVDALFSGGNELTLSLISKDAPLKPGDLVITASRDLVYGLEAGRIKTVEEISATPFKKAVLEPSFKLSELKDVKISKISH